MKNEVYINGKVKRLNEYDNYWRAWVVVPKGGGRDGTTSVLVVGYDELPGGVAENAAIEIVGRLGWRKRVDDEFELVVIADDVRVLRRQRDGRNGGNGGSRQVAKRKGEEDDDIPF